MKQRSTLDDQHQRAGKLLSILLLGVIALSFSAISYAPVTVAQATVNVTINNFSFTPSTITVVIGVNNTVTWTQEQSGVPYHTVTSDTNSWGSGDLTAGQTFTYTFTSPGTYGYHCSLHTYMKGTVIVLSSEGSTGTSTSTSSTTASSSSTSSTTTASTSTTTSSSSSASNAVPEFPTQAIAVAVVASLVVASYAILRRSRLAGR